jgi:hypothetical protein
MVTWRASSNMLRGTKLPANKKAAEMRGSTTASRIYVGMSAASAQRSNVFENLLVRDPMSCRDSTGTPGITSIDLQGHFVDPVGSRPARAV